MRNLFVILTLTLCSQLCAQDFALANTDSSDFFNFWEGTWEGTWPEANNTVGKATNRIEWTTGGKVLQENFEITAGQNRGFIGTSISVFNATTKIWRQAWADNQGGYFDFIGDFDGNKRIFKTHPREVKGQMIISRMVFYDLKKDSFMWDWERSTDGGETWSLNWRISYVRKGV